MTKRKWRAAIKLLGVAVILATLGLGAMQISPTLLPEWIPIQWVSVAAILFIFGAIAIGAVAFIFVIVSSWGWIRGVRVQVVHINGNNNVVGNRNMIQTAPIKRREPVRMTYDNVLWEDAGLSRGVIVHGPYCPKCLTPLATKHRMDGQVDTELRDNDYYSKWGSPLVCLQCQAEYVLDENKNKRLEQSKQEVRVLFEGKRRRTQQEEG